MSTQEDDMDSLERSSVALNYTPNFQNIFSSDNQSASNGTSPTLNKERINLPTPPLPSHCNQIVQPQSPLQQSQSPFNHNPQQPQPQPQHQHHSQSQSNFQPLPQSPNSAMPQLRFHPPSPLSLQQHLQQPPLLSQQQQQQNQDHVSQQDFTNNQPQRVLISDAQTFNQSQITNRSNSVPNLEQQQQQQQQPTRNASTSYIASTSPLIQPANTHQQTNYYQCPNEQFQRNSLSQQNIVNHNLPQQRYSPNQQPSSENARGQFYAYSRLQTNQQPQTRASPNLSPSTHTHLPNNTYYNTLRPVAQQQVMQNHMQPQVPPGYNLVPGRIIIQPQTLQNQYQQSQYPNQYQQRPCLNQHPHLRILRLASPPPSRPLPPQQTINHRAHSGIPTHNSPEISNAPHLARALAPIRSSNIDALSNLATGYNQRQQTTSSDCFIRPPTANTSHNQASNSSTVDNNSRLRLAHHVSRRARNTAQQNHSRTNTAVIDEPGSNTIATTDPQVVRVVPVVGSYSSSFVQSAMPPAPSPKTQSIATQTEPGTANKAMQFDGKLKLLENKALNATVQMEDKSCQTDELLDKPVTTKIYVDRASSPVLSAGLTVLQANNDLKHIPVRMKKTTKRRDLNCNGEEINSKVRKLESSSDTDVDIETLE